MLVLILVGAVLHIAGAGALRTSWWGVHFFAYYPTLLLLVATILLLGGAVLSFALRPRAGTGDIRAWLEGPRRFVTFGAGLALLAIFFWIARTRNTYLGDGNVLGGSLVHRDIFHPREPLTMFLHHLFYRGAQSLGSTGEIPPETLAERAVAVGSVVAGVLFIVVAWLLATELARLVRPAKNQAPRSRAPEALLWLTLVGQGYIQLFFGYVENYTYYTLGIALYLWTALRYLRGAAPLMAPAAAWLLTLTLHLSAGVLAPSLAVLGAWGLWRKDTRVAALRDIGIAAVAAFAVRLVLGRVSPGYDLFAAVIGGAGNLRALGGNTVSGYLLSAKHVRDFVNEQFLIGPLGLWWFLPALALPLVAGRLRSAAVGFMAALGGAYLVVTWFAGDSNLGYARNWDLFAPSGLVFTVAGWGLALCASSSLASLRPALVCAVLLSLFHTIPWIGTNASESRSYARLIDLPLWLGRTEVLASSWHRQHGNPEEATRWLERAIQVNPKNNNAHYLLGVDYFEAGDMEHAVGAFDRAVQLRPDKVLFRQMLVMSLFGVGRGADALPHLEFILSRSAGNATDWALYGESLKAAGRLDEARTAFEKALPMVQQTLQRHPEEFTLNVSVGQLLYQVDRFQEALQHFERALAADPNSETALSLMGYALRHLGRDEEASVYFRRCLQVNPNHPDHQEMQAFLSGR